MQYRLGPKHHLQDILAWTVLQKNEELPVRVKYPPPAPQGKAYK